MRVQYILALIGLIGLSPLAYAEPNSVEVTNFPFELRVMEDGHITFNNLDGDKPLSFVAHGWFEGVVAEGEVLVVQLPITNCGTTCYEAGEYYIKDRYSNEYSVLTIVAPPEPEPEPQPVVQQVQQQEPIYDVQRVEEISNNEFQQKLVDLTNSLNSSVETIALQKNEISELEFKLQTEQTRANSLSQQLNILNNTSVSNTRVIELQQQIQSLSANSTSANAELRSLESDLAQARSELLDVRDNMTQVTQERDEWKQLAHSWYAVAMEQLQVMVNVLGL